MDKDEATRPGKHGVKQYGENLSVKKSCTLAPFYVYIYMRFHGFQMISMCVQEIAFEIRDMEIQIFQKKKRGSK